MGRTYAGILGTLGCVVTAGRALLAGNTSDATLLHAWWALVISAAVGAALGCLAGAMVEEAVRKQIEQEWPDIKPNPASK